MRGWIGDGLLPGAAVDIRHEKFHYRTSFGNSRADTIYDLASLTKVTATLPGLLILAQREALKFSDRVSRYIPEFRYDAAVTILHLLTHTSGLPADLPYAPRNASRDVLALILDQQPLSEPGTRMVYSDLGMILLGEIVQRVSGQRLDRFLTEQVFQPLGMKETMFRPPPALRDRIAPTEYVDGEPVQGEVHDEKSVQMGGICGSAGLFSTAADMSTYAEAWLHPEEQTVLPADLMKQSVRHLGHGRALGWEVYGLSPPVGCGTRWSPGTFGHTGFTGTSIWIDPVKRVSAVVFSNAVHFGRDNRIRKLRPGMHDAIFASLFD
ncbi:serine hydrolase domain-containing protein [Cohnella kolymensis]|nr:serine hydrolase domain-containing protein [Cohnella kolymensis]